MSAAEALACGRPVVASKVDALPDLVVDGENGMLVPPDDSRALADALLRILRNPERGRELGAAGRRRVRDLHSMEVYTRRILGLYTEILGRRKLDELTLRE